MIRQMKYVSVFLFCSALFLCLSSPVFPVWVSVHNYSSNWVSIGFKEAVNEAYDWHYLHKKEVPFIKPGEHVDVFRIDAKNIGKHEEFFKQTNAVFFIRKMVQGNGWWVKDEGSLTIKDLHNDQDNNLARAKYASDRGWITLLYSDYHIHIAISDTSGDALEAYGALTKF